MSTQECTEFISKWTAAKERFQQSREDGNETDWEILESRRYDAFKDLSEEASEMICEILASKDERMVALFNDVLDFQYTKDLVELGTIKREGAEK